MEVEAVSCECCGLEECMGEYNAGVRAYFEGWWLCGLCSESVKYESGKCAGGAAPGVEDTDGRSCPRPRPIWAYLSITVDVSKVKKYRRIDPLFRKR
jgi:hypothetical protein